jgi:hypothetical protein
MKRSRYCPRITIPIGVIALTWIGFLILREQHRPDGLIVGQFAIGDDGRFAIAVTNASHRKITYQVMQPMFNFNGIWSRPVPVSSVFVNGRLIIQSPKVLAGQTADTFRVARPLHIAAGVPIGASAWRVAVVWNYTSASFVQKVHAELMSIIQGRTFTIQPQYYTNYSGAIGL